MQILIVRISALGDAIHTLPALDILRKNLPLAKIDWLAQHKSLGIVDHIPGIRKVYKLHDQFLRPKNLGKTFATLHRLRSQKYDLVIDFQGLCKTSALIMGIGAPSIGFCRKTAREGISSLVHTRTVSPVPTLSIIEKNRTLARAAVKALTGHEPIHEFSPGRLISAPQPTSAASAAVARWAKTRSRLIVLTPNTTWASKHWPIERWSQLLSTLPTLKTHTFVLVGEKFGTQGAQLAEIIRKNKLPIEIAPAWTLNELFAVMAYTDVIIAPDTGLLHVADCLGVTTIGLYGPTKLKRHGPQISPDNLNHCFQVQCLHLYQKTHQTTRMHSLTQDCMYKLSVNSILERIDAIINRKNIQPKDNTTRKESL